MNKYQFKISERNLMLYSLLIALGGMKVVLIGLFMFPGVNPMLISFVGITLMGSGIFYIMRNSFFQAEFILDEEKVSMKNLVNFSGWEYYFKDLNEVKIFAGSTGDVIIFETTKGRKKRISTNVSVESPIYVEFLERLKQNTEVQRVLA
jgi:hypothetical protein